MLGARARRVAREAAWLDAHTHTLETAKAALETLVTRLAR